MRMCKTISFNSWNEYFKAPFGALKTNEGAKIRVNSNSDNVYSINLIIEKEKEDENPISSTEIIISKHRNGETGIINLNFNKNKLLFE